MTSTTSPKPFLRRPATLLLVAAAIAIVASGLSLRWSRAEVLAERAASHAVRSVALVAPVPVELTGLELPARIEAWSRAPIHARVGGYLRHWHVDIGSRVKAGQLLAEIETPELDQQLQQARAELARARSEATLAGTTAQRWQALLASDSVSRQEAEERAAEFQARQAQVDAVQANVERLQALQQFKRLVAPFDGTVTARNTDVGALVNVGTGAAGSALFVVSDTRRLRVYIDVPQRQIGAVRTGTQAQLRVPEHADRNYAVTVQSLAQAIDLGTGAMRAQLTVDNTAGELLPGGYATVRFAATAGDAAPALGLPPSALILGRDGVQVATVDAESRARLRRVTIARDHGSIVELGQGLQAGERVINNPPDGIADGDPVRIASAGPDGTAP